MMPGSRPKSDAEAACGKDFRRVVRMMKPFLKKDELELQCFKLRECKALWQLSGVKPFDHHNMGCA